MGTAADLMWEQYEQEQEAEEAAERAARLATPEGRKAERERERVNEAVERATQEAKRAEAEQEQKWAADHPDEWEAWLRVRDLLVFEFGGVNFPDFLKAVGDRRSKDRVLRRKDPSKQYTLDNLRWVKQKPKGGLKPEVVEQLVHTLKEVKDSLADRPTAGSETPSAVNAGTPTDPNGSLTKADVARRLRVSERQVNRWMSEGKLKSFRLGQVVRFFAADVEAFEAKHRTGRR